MKTIKVVAAVICDNMKEKNKIFCTQEFVLGRWDEKLERM